MGSCQPGTAKSNQHPKNTESQQRAGGGLRDSLHGKFARGIVELVRHTVVNPAPKSGGIVQVGSSHLDRGKAPTLGGSSHHVEHHELIPCHRSEVDQIEEQRTPAGQVSTVEIEVKSFVEWI